MAIEFESAQDAAKPGRAGSSLGRGRVRATDRRFFTEQLSLLLETGINLHGALNGLAEQCERSALRELITDLAERVAEGQPFSRALAEHPEVFDASYANLVAAAEQGGFLPDVLTELLELDERREELRSALTGAAAYPAFLMAFSIGVVLFILWVVFPKFGDMFARIYDQLPVSTQMLMAASNVLRDDWPVLLVISVAVFMCARLWWRSAAGRQAIDRAKLTWPGLRQVFVPVYLVRMLRPMGLSLQHGVSVVDTLKGCRDVAANRSIASFLGRVEDEVVEGQRFAKAFARADFLPPLVRQMLATGDETGTLGKVMLRVAAHYERDIRRQLSHVSKIAEPAMLLIMGALVGVIVSSLILPIFKLTRAVG